MAAAPTSSQPCQALISLLVALSPHTLGQLLSQAQRRGYSRGQEAPGALGQSQAGEEAKDQVQDEEQEVGEPPEQTGRDGQGSRAELPTWGPPGRPGPLPQARWTLRDSNHPQPVAKQTRPGGSPALDRKNPACMVDSSSGLWELHPASARTKESPSPAPAECLNQHGPLNFLQ